MPISPFVKSVNLPFAQPLVPGRLIRRYQRFLADIVLEESGETVLAHCPNSGSMLGCDKEGAPVYLSRQPSPKRRTRYTWEMIRIGRGWVGINTGLPNQLIAKAAELKAHPVFAGVMAVRREVKVSDRSRLDLVVERKEGPLFIEVKNVTLAERGRALFPDAVTTRGTKHLRELMALAGRGMEAAMVYLVQRPDARDFAPARAIDPEYAEMFDQARAAGVGVYVWQAGVNPKGIRLKAELPLAADI